MASTGATLPAQFKPDQLFSNFDLLQKAIQFGDVEKAKQIVSDLAKNKASVEVTEKQDKLQLRNDDEISVKIYIEDKDLSGSQLTMKIATSLKIKELKMMMLKNHGFAPEIQKWIIGKKIVKDEDTLYRLRVKSGSAMYLYLLSPQSVGLSREVYAQKYGADLPYGTPGLPVTQEEGVRFQRLPRSTAPPTPQNNARVNVRESTGNGDYMVPLQSPPPLLRTNPPPAQPVQPPAPQEPERLHYTDVGWTCPQCTYKNEPTRPGCEMCSHDRPDDYTMPDGVEYEMTDKEKRRLQREKDTERLAEQSEQHEMAQQLDSFLGLRILDEENELEGQRQRLRLSGLDDQTIQAILDAQMVVPAAPLIQTASIIGNRVFNPPTQESGDFADNVESYSENNSTA